jgi:N-acetyl-alpha-D-muramate 1-phosphate uridylyltransferase
VTMLPLALLAGGLATRLGSLTHNKPKSLVEVAGEPFIAHQLRLLRQQDVEDVVVCAGHLGQMIEDLVGDGQAFGLRVRYSYDGPTLLGTAGALRKALPLLGEAFFVMYGDSLLPIRYAPVQTEFLSRRQLGLMTVYRNDGLWGTSNVEYAGGRILVYDKQHPTSDMRHIDYGLGLLWSVTVADLVTELPCDLASLYQRLVERNQLEGYEVHERFYEIGSPGGIAETRNYLRKQPHHAVR